MMQTPATKARVLVVDDEAPARMRLLELLRQVIETKHLFEADSGHSAVETIRTERPNLVFLDIQMPEMGGFEVVDAVGALRMP